MSHQGTENYVRAIEMCKEAMKYAGDDKELEVDALSLQGICLYRLGHLLEATRILHQARREKNRLVEQRQHGKIKHFTMQQYSDLVIQDMGAMLKSDEMK